MYFLDDWWHWTYFHVTITHLYLFFRQMPVLILLLISELDGWKFAISVCKFLEGSGYQYLTKHIIIKLLSYSTGCFSSAYCFSLFLLLCSYLVWHDNIWLSFAFITYSFDVISKIVLSGPMSKSFVFIFPSRNFTGLGFVFKSLIHLELILMYDVRVQFHSLWIVDFPYVIYERN